jgi:succinate dehydrogenase/fumarate reductase flavoprotein subunit
MEEKNMKKDLSRRGFIKGAAVAGAAGVVGLIGMSAGEAMAIPFKKVKKWDYTTDVLVVGYGAAGGNAAIAAHDAGCKVLLIEKMEIAGGNSGVCAGSMNLPTNIEDAVDYYRKLSFGTVDEPLIKAFAEAMVGLPDMLRKMGAKFDEIPSNSTYPALLKSKIKVFHFLPNGAGGFKFLADQVEKRGIKPKFKTRVMELVNDPDTREILGVRAESNGKTIYIKARKAVVLACGGYENNKEMQGFYNYPGLSDFVWPWGTPGNTGDGLKMAFSVGAQCWHSSGLEWGSFCSNVASKELGGVAVGYGLGRSMSTGSYLFVNKYGKRFMDEQVSPVHRKTPLEVLYFDSKKAEYTNIPCYMIFDEAYQKQGAVAAGVSYFNQVYQGPVGYNMVHNIHVWSDDNQKELDKGWIVKADTIEELAQKIKVDPKGLEETISKFNIYKATGKDTEFDRKATSAFPLETPPFYGVELGLALINTQGGPRHNLHAQVLDYDNKPIPRLYAAGELGSFFGFLYQGGNNFPEAWAFGQIAGKNAAAEKPTKR